MQNYKNTSSEVKAHQFQSFTLTPDLLHKIRDQKISSTDILIMALVANLTIHQDSRNGIEGKGCWASNAYIGRATNTHKKHISERIQKLEKMGLLLIINYEGDRYLELEWLRSAEERRVLSGEYGKLYREVYKEMETLLKKSKTNESEDGVRFFRTTPPGKPVSPPPGKPGPNNVFLNMKEREEVPSGFRRTASRSSEPPVSSSFPDSKTTDKQSNARRDAARHDDDNRERQRSNSIEQKPVRDSSTKRIDKGKDTYENEYEKAAVDLRNGFIKANRLSSKFNKKEWSNTFRLLHTKDGCKDWKEITYFAIKHLAISDINDLKLPSFTDPSALRKPQIYDWLSKVYYHQKKLKQSFYNENFYTSIEEAEMDKLDDHEV